MDTAKTAGGWAVIIGAAATFWWVNNQRKNKNRRTAVPKPATKLAEPRKEPKAKKGKKDAGSDHDTKPAQKKKTAQPPKTEEKAYTSAVDDTTNDEVDNREFARQLSNAKSGTIMAGKAQASSTRPKSVKQTRAQEKPVEHSSDNATAPSSTTGADADDDESPLNSPELAATSMAPVTNGDVSDMLEKPAAAPQVLKITPATNPTAVKKAKAAEVKETKKQRQNRLKAEASRLAREEDEKERKVLEEKQRRTAREAEGRAAKDGSVFMASKAPASSAWTAPAAAAPAATTAAPAEKKGTSSSDFEMLDTYDKAKTNGNGTKPSEAPASKLATEYHGLSEEEQMRIIQEESADWKTVSKEKRKKKTPAKETEEPKEEKLGGAGPESKDSGAPPVMAPTAPGQAWSTKTVHVEQEARKVVEREIEIQDSEWEVA
jgi:hypothetical protein